ncbi:MAG TPA: NAD(P)-dependent oxidoreductase [Gemmatimonadaceae bacterium]|nr:NAD(P)-dependent oxidoreductase [Gemmatimonadaceae bacterium]
MTDFRVTPRQRVFVTGATGEIGRRVVPELVRRGHRVTAVGRDEQRRAELIALGADAVALDMFDAVAARRALDGHDAVINLATHMPPSTIRMMLPWEWRENDRIRREGSAILVDAAVASGVVRFVQESFAPIYEDGGDGWIDEGWPVKPASYNRTVLDAEHSAQRFIEAGRSGVVARFAWFYGADKLMRDMIGLVRRGWSPFPGRGDSFWPSISHQDAASAVCAALDAPAGTYNICDDEPVTRRVLADLLAESIGSAKPRLMPSWLSHVGGSGIALMSRSLRMSNAAFKAATGWAPRWRSVRQGFPEIARQLGERDLTYERVGARA